MGSKSRDIPGEGAIFTTTIDPAVQAALKAGFQIDLTRVRETPTAGAEEEVQQALGQILTAIFPNDGAIALKPCREARALVIKRLRGDSMQRSTGSTYIHTHTYALKHTYIYGTAYEHTHMATYVSTCTNTF